MTESEKQTLLNEQHTLILRNEANLSASDYIAAKIAEGKATKTEYKEQIKERQEWRDGINAARAIIAELEATETDEPEPELIPE